MLRTSLKLVQNVGEINRRMVAKRRRVMYRTGGYGLKVIRSKVRSRKKTSRPGEPPNSKTKAFKKNSRFSFDEYEGELKVGFTKFPSSYATVTKGGDVTGVIEGGGRERLNLPRRVVKRPDGRERVFAPKTVSAVYKARPVIGPSRPVILKKLQEFAETTPL